MRHKTDVSCAPKGRLLPCDLYEKPVKLTADTSLFSDNERDLCITISMDTLQVDHAFRSNCSPEIIKLMRTALSYEILTECILTPNCLADEVLKGLMSFVTNQGTRVSFCVILIVGCKREQGSYTLYL